MHILMIAGSLRKNSSNAKLMRAMAKLAQGRHECILYEGLGALPHFNPDLDVDPLPKEVSELRALIARSDRVVISSPEYAHGVPGSLKNALDWLVPSVEFPGKVVMLVNSSADTGEFVQAQLGEVLRTMSARLLPGFSIRAAEVHRTIDEHGNVRNPELTTTLADLLAKLEQ